VFLSTPSEPYLHSIRTVFATNPTRGVVDVVLDISPKMSILTSPSLLIVHVSADSIQTVFVTDPSQGVVDIANPARLADGAGHAANRHASMDVELEDDRCGACGERRETFCTHCS
jgi:hypothetical protein